MSIKDIENDTTDECVVVAVQIDKKESDDKQQQSEERIEGIPVDEDSIRSQWGPLMCNVATRCTWLAVYIVLSVGLLYLVICLWLMFRYSSELLENEEPPYHYDYWYRSSEECHAIVNGTSVSGDAPQDHFLIEFEVGYQGQEPLDLKKLQTIFQQQLLPEILGCGAFSNPLPQVRNALVMDIEWIGACTGAVGDNGACTRLAMDLLVEFNDPNQRTFVQNDIELLLAQYNGKYFVEMLNLWGSYDFIDFEVTDPDMMRDP